jgi:hypothetical protein
MVQAGLEVPAAEDRASIAGVQAGLEAPVQIALDTVAIAEQFWTDLWSLRMGRGRGYRKANLRIVSGRV